MIPLLLIVILLITLIGCSVPKTERNRNSNRDVHDFTERNDNDFVLKSGLEEDTRFKIIYYQKNNPRVVVVKDREDPDAEYLLFTAAKVRCVIKNSKKGGTQ